MVRVTSSTHSVPVLDSAASLVRSTGVPDAVVQHLQLHMESVKLIGQGVRFNSRRGLHDACWAFEVPYRKATQHAEVDPDTLMITRVPRLQDFLNSCWSEISPVPGKESLFSVRGGTSKQDGKGVLVVAFHKPIWAPILDYDQVLQVAGAALMRAQGIRQASIPRMIRPEFFTPVEVVIELGKHHDFLIKAPGSHLPGDYVA